MVPVTRFCPKSSFQAVGEIDMSKTSICKVGAFVFFTFNLAGGIASAKSYEVMLGEPAMAGNTQLPPGEYKVKVDGSQAVFMDEQNSKSWTVPVEVGNSDAKFDQTMVQMKSEGSVNKIREIDLRGSTTKLEFGQ